MSRMDVKLNARMGELPTGAERRQATRMPVAIEARMRELGSEGVEVRVLNLSPAGFMAETEGEFEVGSRVWLMLPGLERANALVKWTAGTKIGGEFAEPIDLAPLGP
ncbi:PilZ domain-containing protein [Sphingomonas sp. ASV193]|uniref:PilZ domain-containing protein n=1 Tax=Sphingomonas sp. ASV193 TaxID=3144405 RepID=UPI0032E8B27E